MPDTKTIDADNEPMADTGAPTIAGEGAPVAEQQAVAVQEAPQAPMTVETDPVLILAARLATVPGMDKEMFKLVMEAQAQEKAAIARERFHTIMNLCQAAIAPVARTVQNTQTGSFYAKLEAVDYAIRPIYTRHGFDVQYDSVPPLVQGNIRIACYVSLGRHTEAFHREAAPDTHGPKGTQVKTFLHGGASAETFLKRYAVTGAFNVVFRNLDDDGHKGGFEPLDEEQIDELRALLDETETEPTKFFAAMIDGEVNTFSDISRASFSRLKTALLTRRRQRAAKGTAP